MGDVVSYPWVAGPLVVSRDLLQLVRHLTPHGALTVPLGGLTMLYVEGVRRFGIPVLAAGPGALFVALAVVARRFGSGPSARRRAPVLPFESAQPCGTGIDTRAPLDASAQVVTHGDLEAR
ncbi:MAG TPA: hypothetical protein VMR97_02475 [Acidimicrobiales bacterium]|nr:hypothetical protein [Acidimicrobiales bacterium]